MSKKIEEGKDEKEAREHEEYKTEWVIRKHRQTEYEKGHNGIMPEIELYEYIVDALDRKPDMVRVEEYGLDEYVNNLIERYVRRGDRKVLPEILKYIGEDKEGKRILGLVDEYIRFMSGYWESLYKE